MLIGLDVGGTKLLAVGEFHEYFIGPVDDMVGGEDVAVCGDDDACALVGGDLEGDDGGEGQFGDGWGAGRDGMTVLILTTVGMIRLETARNALETAFAAAMSLASSARPTAPP